MRTINYVIEYINELGEKPYYRGWQPKGKELDEEDKPFFTRIISREAIEALQSEPYKELNLHLKYLLRYKNAKQFKLDFYRDFGQEDFDLEEEPELKQILNKEIK